MAASGGAGGPGSGGGGGAGPEGGGGGRAGGGGRKFKLQKESELRVEVGMDAPLRLQLMVGTAEIFGTELPPAFWLTFPPAHKFAVSSLYSLILVITSRLLLRLLISEILTRRRSCQGFRVHITEGVFLLNRTPRGSNHQVEVQR